MAEKKSKKVTEKPVKATKVAKVVHSKAPVKKVAFVKPVKKGLKTFKLASSGDAAALSSIDESKVTLVTRDGLIALKKELDYLENTRRKEIAAKIKEAVSYGDLSENSEYEEAKNEQAFVEGRIMQLTEQVKYAQIIDDEAALQKSSKQMHVQLGNKVKIRALSGKNAGTVLEYVLVGTTEADPLAGKISNESPVGAKLLNNIVGDKIDVKVPAGVVTYEILHIS
jgi:transcription elongation factor GreA